MGRTLRPFPRISLDNHTILPPTNLRNWQSFRKKRGRLPTWAAEVLEFDFEYDTVPTATAVLFSTTFYPGPTHICDVVTSVLSASLQNIEKIKSAVVVTDTLPDHLAPFHRRVLCAPSPSLNRFYITFYLFNTNQDVDRLSPTERANFGLTPEAIRDRDETLRIAGHLGETTACVHTQ